MSRLFSRLARQAMGLQQNPVRPVVAQPFENQAGAVSKSSGSSTSTIAVYDRSNPAGQPQANGAPTSANHPSAGSHEQTANGPSNRPGTAEPANSPTLTISPDQGAENTHDLPVRRDAYVPMQHEHQKPNIGDSSPQAGVVATNSTQLQHGSGMMESTAPTASDEAIEDSPESAVSVSVPAGRESPHPHREVNSGSPDALLPEAAPNSSDHTQHAGKADSLAPEQLLPDRDTGTAHHPAVTSAPRQTQSVSHTSDEIHVHIGRIEVRAVADTQDGSRQRGRASKQKTLSLEDYLAKRGGRR